MVIMRKRAEGAREPALSETEGNLPFACGRPFRDREDDREGHELTRAVRLSKMHPRFSA